MRSAETRGIKVVERILGFDAALGVVLEKAAGIKPRGSEAVPLPKSLGRVLAAAVRSDRDQPPFDRSTRDGFAVRAEELMAGAWLSVAGQVRAGEEWGGGTLQSGQAIEAMTGAPVPEGADAVVMLEHVERDGDRIRLTPGRKLGTAENIVPRGSEARGGDEVLPAGTEMTPAAIALAAGCGAAMVTVFERPAVSVLATGDELVDIGEAPGAAQIRNSNSYGMEALVTQAGGGPVRLPVARDERVVLEQSIGEARKADLLLLSGGVSMGEYDLVEDVLLSLGAEFFFTGVKMQPGKPLVFGRLPERDGAREIFFFGLPGNPVSTQVTFAAFVEPLLRAMRGGAAGVPRFVQAMLGEDVSGRPGLTRLLPAKIDFDRVRPEVRLVAWQGSGDMAANARANCYAVFPEDIERFASGEMIAVLLK
jgi:molybdopterin molybdotransferase